MSFHIRENIEEMEGRDLASYAFRSAETEGRTASEKADVLRTEFQRDRDRIVHSHAFRKLELKTQVYVTHEGEYFRTRLTHTIEVAQIARSMARSLGLNQDLTEAIGLAHDLGHTPFGHAGERVLAEMLAETGGFEHNVQSLRVVERLEKRFHDRPGLNLSYEVREGIALHSDRREHPDIARYCRYPHPALEAQLVDIADEIAYNHHDLDDALKMGLLKPDQLREIEWIWEIWEEERLKLAHDGPDPEFVKFRALGAIIDRMVHSALVDTLRRLNHAGVETVDDVRRHPVKLAEFEPEMRSASNDLRAFLMANVYRHPMTMRMMTKAGGFLRRLFELYRDQPELLPHEQQRRIGDEGLMRVLTDYFSGMTDRQCLQEYMTNFRPTFEPGPMAF